MCLFCPSLFNIYLFLSLPFLSLLYSLQLSLTLKRRNEYHSFNKDNLLTARPLIKLPLFILCPMNDEFPLPPTLDSWSLQQPTSQMCFYHFISAIFIPTVMAVGVKYFSQRGLCPDPPIFPHPHA